MTGEGWHGLCHEIGQSGNCGIDCPIFNGLEDEECEAMEEIILNSNPDDLDFTHLELMNNFVASNSGVKNHIKDYLLNIYMSKLQIGIIENQTKFDTTVEDQLLLIIESRDKG